MDSFLQIERQNQLLQRQGQIIRKNLNSAEQLKYTLRELAQQIQQVQSAARQAQMDARAAKAEIGAPMKGDINTPVVAEWRGLNDDGTGTVSYNDKEYKTVPLKTLSTAPGTKVEMIYSDGIYYSQI